MEKENMGIFFTILTILILIIVFALPLLIAEVWIKNQGRIFPKSKPVKHKNLTLRRKIQQILSRSNNRNIAVNRLKKLLLQHGYKVSFEKEYFIQFSPVTIFTLKNPIHINLERYVKKVQMPNSLTPLFESIISMQTKIAKSDGIISATEAKYIKNSITHFIAISRQDGLSSAAQSKLRQRLVQAHERAKDHNTLISAYAKKLRNYKFQIKEQALQQLISIAVLDGYTQLKESLIFNAGTTMGFNSLQIRRYIDDLRGVKKEYSRDSSLYKILECKSTDSNATIKKSYRELVKKYHSDFMYSKKLDESYIESSKRKLQEINMAYAKIKKERGM